MKTTSLREICVIPVLKDNYSFLLLDYTANRCLAVDPVVPRAILDRLSHDYPSFALQGILTTHHHWDHSGGNTELLQLMPHLKVYGGDTRIPGLTHLLRDGEDLDFGSLSIKSIATPCHTSGSLSYFVTRPSDNLRAVFTGDTLFVGGCGRFFEGSAQDMYTSLVQKLGSLPKETLVYCGHEYTLKNLEFAQTIEPDNHDLQDKVAWAKALKCTIPSTIAQEWKTNPFMRVGELYQKLGLGDPIVTMKQIRDRKDAF